MNAPSWIALACVALYALFHVWYGGRGRPLAPDETRDLLAELQRRVALLPANAQARIDDVAEVLPLSPHAARTSTPPTNQCLLTNIPTSPVVGIRRVAIGPVKHRGAAPRRRAAPPRLPVRTADHPPASSRSKRAKNSSIRRARGPASARALAVCSPAGMRSSLRKK